MGCGASQQPVPYVVNSTKNEVDEQLAKMQEDERHHYKILLLGPGEAGKSTVLKQLKCIYKGGIPLAEQRMHGMAIRRNTIQCMQAIVEATGALEVELDDESAAAAMRIERLDETAQLDPSVVEMLKNEIKKCNFRGRDDSKVRERIQLVVAGGHLSETFFIMPVTEARIDKDILQLWQDDSVQLVYSQRHSYWLLDAAAYYFNNVERFAADTFAPNEEDMLMARARTSGIMVTRITDAHHKFSVVDVGGQRSERRKWIHCFDDVKAIIFVVALSGYNQVLFEDTNVNRLHEGLQLFEEVVQNPIFENTPIFVFLNKKDLFEQMIREGTPLTRCFPDYRPDLRGDASDVHNAIEEIERRFQEVMHKHSPRKHLYVHVIASRVRLEMKSAFTDVKDKIKEFYARGSANTPLQVTNRI